MRPSRTRWLYSSRMQRGALHLRRFAFDFKVVVLQERGDVQVGFEKLQILVEGAKQLADPSGYSYSLFH